MTSGTPFYQTELARHQADVAQNKKVLLRLSILRLSIFVVMCLGIYWVIPSVKFSLFIIIGSIALFLFLLKKHIELQDKKKLSEALAQINEEELQIASGDFHHRADGKQFLNPSHHYSQDIDLFGRGSFFQYVNRTETSEGAQALANVLCANDIENIPAKQEAIKELNTLAKWRQLFSGTARLIKVESSAPEIVSWLHQYKPFVPNYMRWLPKLFSLCSVITIVLYAMDIIPGIVLGMWFLLGLVITGGYKRKMDLLSEKISRVKDTFKQYASLLQQIESQDFSAAILKEKQQKIMSSDKKASEVFEDFSKRINAFDQRENKLTAIVSGGFMLWDIGNTYKIEEWIQGFNGKVEDWLEVVSFFDAYNSLGNYAFNKPQYIYPNIVASGTAIDTKELGHPLLLSDKRVDNDVRIENQEFFIVTGANMAGKSTWLRTVSLHIVMANIGLPICASQSNYTPVKLITSMRTVDSLTDDSSYFFSELTRLKFIIDEIKREPYFIILDEILKGTNSTDKAIGSKKFVEKLVASDATGIIATHDLSLCEIEKELKDIKNYYFDAQIINDELHFDYSFKKGICQNMNASFLLKKMEIV
jgi:DNA mismatch repair ATPase MutS